MSENFGLSWRQIEEKIGYFSWSVKGVDLNERTIFIQRNQPSGLSAILSSSEFFQNKKSMKVWLAYVEKMKVIGRFIFATRRIRPFGVRTYSYQLWISVDRKLFYRAIIPLSEEPINFHIADVSPDIIFLCVTYNDSTTHLYTSGMFGNGICLWNLTLNALQMPISKPSHCQWRILYFTIQQFRKTFPE